MRKAKSKRVWQPRIFIVPTMYLRGSIESYVLYCVDIMRDVLVRLLHLLM